jgi:excisionase family DNA binding protein
MEQVFFNVPLSELEPIFKKWIKEAQTEQRAENPIKESQTEKLLNVQQAAEFLGLSVPTIYSKVSRNELPVMKRSKRLYFSNIELLAYLKAGKKLTGEELKEAAEKYVSERKKG